MLDASFNVEIQDLLRICTVTLGVFIAVITYTRIAGLRSFSKMSGFDFAMTIAVGSLMATIAIAQVPFIEGLVALAVLFLIQVVIAYARRYKIVTKIIDNQPVLLFENGRFLYGNMKQARITRKDVLSKMREANVMSLNQVQAVVLETTGDISILHGGKKLESVLLEGVTR